jgi:hypothetical protein
VATTLPVTGTPAATAFNLALVAVIAGTVLVVIAARRITDHTQ